jgi:hypothetical protein
VRHPDDGLSRVSRGVQRANLRTAGSHYLASDEEAVEVARAMTPISVEIWQGARFIVSLPRSADRGDRKA